MKTPPLNFLWRHPQEKKLYLCWLAAALKKRFGPFLITDSVGILETGRRPSEILPPDPHPVRYTSVSRSPVTPIVPTLIARAGALMQAAVIGRFRKGCSQRRIHRPAGTSTTSRVGRKGRYFSEKKMRLTTRIKTFRCFPRSLLQKFQYCPNHKRGSSALNLRFHLLTDGDLTDHFGRLSFFLDFIFGGYFCEFVCPFCLHEVKSPWSHEHDLAKAV